MALKDILSNPKYGDDLVITIGTGTEAETIKVGEIRALPAEERRALTTQLEERQNTLGQAELRFNALFQQAVHDGWLMTDDKGKVVVAPRPQFTPASQSQQQPTAADLRRAAAAEYNLDENDPLLGPVVKEMKAQLAERDKTLTELQTKLDALPSQFNSLRATLTDSLGKVTGVVNATAGRYLNDTYQSQFAAATKDLPAGIKVDYEVAYKYASDHGLKDKDGFLLVSEAVDRLTWNDRKKAELEKERAALVAKTTKDLEEKNKLATLTPPSARNPLTSKPKEGEFDPFNERTDAKGNKVKVVKSFEEAMAAAATDEDVLKSALGTASFGTVQ
jgi:hypothetical protein